MKISVVSALRGASPHHRLIVNYSPTLAMYRMENENIRSANPVMPLRARDSLAQAKPDELRWRVITNTSHKTLQLSTQRNRLRRRWGAALQQSLKKQGLAQNGKKDVSQEHMPHTPEIAGTLEILVHDGFGFTETSNELLKSTDHIVRALLKAAEGTRRPSSQRQDQRQDRRGQRGGRW